LQADDDWNWHSRLSCLRLDFLLDSRRDYESLEIRCVPRSAQTSTWPLSSNFA
jgi:hypothetical protein